MVSSHANPFHWHPHRPSSPGIFRMPQRPSKPCLWGTPARGERGPAQRRGSPLLGVFSLFPPQMLFALLGRPLSGAEIVSEFFSLWLNNDTEAG